LEIFNNRFLKLHLFFISFFILLLQTFKLEYFIHLNCLLLLTAFALLTIYYFVDCLQTISRLTKATSLNMAIVFFKKSIALWCVFLLNTCKTPEILFCSLRWQLTLNHLKRQSIFSYVIMQINHVTSARILFSSIAWLRDGIYCFLVLFQEIDSLCY